MTIVFEPINKKKKNLSHNTRTDSTPTAIERLFEEDKCR